MCVSRCVCPPSYLGGEVEAAEEEAERTAGDHGDDGQRQQTVAFAVALNERPHLHRHHALYQPFQALHPEAKFLFCLEGSREKRPLWRLNVLPTPQSIHRQTDGWRAAGGSQLVLFTSLFKHPSRLETFRSLDRSRETRQSLGRIYDVKGFCGESGQCVRPERQSARPADLSDV
ncbi:hypothetical protein DPEC_G00151710 [Dallia pectoralis]|uniref:Uncharacterized protein n=1 Tax=Dallia pectoralis TaxID=75939 RepID=A0ACC2GJQ1_DALPE|nr:hypothetical protein DPEC_G00151710 [Dallia pectoralis]